jgi:hypothetical protein
MQEKKARFPIRLAPELLARLTVIAHRERRSVNQQAIAYIERGVEQDEAAGKETTE